MSSIKMIAGSALLIVMFFPQISNTQAYIISAHKLQEPKAKKYNLSQNYIDWKQSKKRPATRKKRLARKQYGDSRLLWQQEWPTNAKKRRLMMRNRLANVATNLDQISDKNNALENLGERLNSITNK